MLQYLSVSLPSSVTFAKYEPCEYLFLYGWGGEEQQKALRQHKGRTVCFDLGYWSREVDRHWRVSIDGWHCPDKILQGASGDRFARYGINVQRSGGDPNGPILLIGNSNKASRIGTGQWVHERIRMLRNETDKPIWYKVKPRRSAEPNVKADRTVLGDIFDVLPKVSMVVCRHSNVAVDAARMGVPVVCDDGAGAAIYPNTLNGPQPTYKQRVEFLHNVAGWQWSTDEIRRGECWKWLKGQL